MTLCNIAASCNTYIKLKEGVEKMKNEKVKQSRTIFVS